MTCTWQQDIYRDNALINTYVNKIRILFTVKQTFCKYAVKNLYPRIVTMKVNGCHITRHLRDNYYTRNNPTNSAKSPKKDWASIPLEPLHCVTMLYQKTAETEELRTANFPTISLIKINADRLQGNTHSCSKKQSCCSTTRSFTGKPTFDNQFADKTIHWQVTPTSLVRVYG